MECDIDFYKHFAWLRKVGWTFACLLLVVRFASATVWNLASAVAMEDDVGEKKKHILMFWGFDLVRS